MCGSFPAWIFHFNTRNIYGTSAKLWALSFTFYLLPHSLTSQTHSFPLHLTFKEMCSGRGAVPLRPWKGSRCRFRRWGHAPSRVSKGGAAYLGFRHVRLSVSRKRASKELLDCRSGAWVPGTPPPPLKCPYPADPLPSQLVHEFPAAFGSSRRLRPREMAALPDHLLPLLGLPGPPPLFPIPSSVPYPATYALQVLPRKNLALETTPGRRMRRPRAAGRGRARGAAGKGPGRPQDNAAAVWAREGARAGPASLSKASLEPPPSCL